MIKTTQEENLTVYDAVMGSGKTTFIIKQMNENKDKKYIYITPNLSECDRIVKACPELYFKQPSDTKGTKLKDLQRLIESEENIASTHALLKNFTVETLELLKNRNYHLILDEAIEPCVKHKIEAVDINIMFKSGYVGVAEDGITLQWLGDEPKIGSRFYQEYKLIQNENLVVFDFNNSGKQNKVFIWEMTKGLFEAFVETTILTYQFEGSILRSYFDLKGISYYVDTEKLDRGIKLGHLINVCMHEGLNSVCKNRQSLGSRGLKRDTNKCKEIAKHIYNYTSNIIPTPSSEIMWTTFDTVKHKMKPKGCAKSYLVHNIKATNDYGHKRTLVYALNRYMDVPIKRYLETKGVEINEDLWSLNEMLQWIFRSAIRNDKPIDIYVPSIRMRELLLEWIEEH